MPVACSSLEEKIRRAKDQVRRQESEYHHKTIDTALSIGSSIFGALFSRKKLSRTNIDRASSSARKAGKVAQERGDVQQAKDELDQLLQQRLEVDDDIAHDIAEIEREYDFSDLQIKKLTIPPLKKDITVEPLSIVWIPSFVDSSGHA